MSVSLHARNRATALVAISVAIGMVGAAFAAVPLYRLFCQVTGYGGTTQVAATGPGRVLARKVVIRFNADTDPGIPWRFWPQQGPMEVNVGEQALAFYKAVNTSNREITGTAVFNVTPAKAGVYFSKVACFCFTEQTLKPGESADMPVTFFVDPAIADDRNLDDVTTITLSYTFYASETDRSARVAPAGGSAKAPAKTTAKQRSG